MANSAGQGRNSGREHGRDLRSRRDRNTEAVDARKTGALISVFLVNCQNLSRGAIEEQVKTLTGISSRVHDLGGSSNDCYKELKLFGPGAGTTATRLIV